MNDAASGPSERVLLVAPTGRDAALARAALERGGLLVLAARTLGDAAEGLEGGAGALLLAQEALDPAGSERLARWVAAQPPWSDLPVLVFTAPTSRIGPVALAEKLAPLGNVIVLERPLRQTSLVSVVRAAIRARRRQYAARDVLLALEREVAARDQFLAMLGHELRNPLSAITMALQVVELRGGGAASREHDIVARQSRQLARIVDDLLDVARVTSGKVTLHRTGVDLSALAAAAAEAHQPQAERSGVALSARVAPGLTVRGDPVRLEQVVANLVGNALKYTPRGGHAELVLEADGPEALLLVRDDGLGIAPEQLGRVFETFAQVHATVDRSRGGLGLGLTVARSLVVMHGGTIEARSAGVGRGSEFRVRLPLAGEPARDAAARPAAPQPQRPRRVLVIEDGEDNRVALRAALQALGHEVLEAADGVEGSERAVRLAPEVVIVDIGLPGVDGYEVARRVRAARGAGVLLVALTGYGQPEDRRAALAAGFDVHLTKPVELATLVATISRSA